MDPRHCPILRNAAKSVAKKLRLCLCSSALLIFAIGLPAQTLARVRSTHTLRCATIAETPEYSSSDDHGPRTTFDTDLCRAVAIAILGPSAHTAITSYPDDVAAVAALHIHKVDLILSLTLDFTHASDDRITFSPIVLYDGVGFLVPSAANIHRPDELSDKKICFLAETQVENSLRSWFARENISFVPFPFQEEGEMEAAFVTGNCTALAGDLTRLTFVRLNFGPLASRYTLLSPDEQPLEVSSDPLAAASPSSDPAFANIVRWTFEVLLNAEAEGLTQHTASTTQNLSSIDASIAILTGQTREIGSKLHLGNLWAVDVLTAVGNYGELFDRDLGDKSPLKLPRAQNHLITHGGLMLALPLK